LQALENEISSHETQLLNVMEVGDELVRQGHFGADRIQDRLTEIRDMWQNLLALSAARRKRLEEAVDFHQVGS
jgi:spectrin beta